MLAEDAIKAAVKDYQTKRAKLSGVSETESVEQAAQAWSCAWVMVLKISWVMISKVLLLGFKSFLDDTCVVNWIWWVMW